MFCIGGSENIVRKAPSAPRHFWKLIPHPAETLFLSRLLFYGVSTISPVFASCAACGGYLPCTRATEAACSFGQRQLREQESERLPEVADLIDTMVFSDERPAHLV